MPIGGSQGIVISIQGKIEGWQEQIKQIQEALNNIKVGSGLEKSLKHQLSQLESMVNNLGKNVNHRLTSAGQITSFTDKIDTVEESFLRIGKSLSSISFKDLDTEYLTQNFKELTDQIDGANKALAEGIQNSINNAVQDSERLKRTFDDLKINPKNLSLDELRKALQDRMGAAKKEAKEAYAEWERLNQKVKEFKTQRDKLSNSKIIKTKDIEAEAKNIIGDTDTVKVQKELNVDYLNKIKEQIEGSLENASAQAKAKQAEIQETLSKLVDSKTIEEAQEHLDKLTNGIHGAGSFIRAEIGKIAQENPGISLINNIFPDEKAIEEKREHIQQALMDFGLKGKTLTKAIGDVDSIIRNGNLDQLPDKLVDILRKAKVASEAELADIKKKYQEALDARKIADSNSMTKAGLVTRMETSQRDLETVIAARVKQETESLRERVAILEKQLQDKALGGAHTVGKNIESRSTEALRASTVQAQAYENQLKKVQSAEQMLGKVQGVVQRWFSIYAAVRMVGNAVRSVISTLKELDTTITEIAIVTDMSQDQLWGQMDQYTKMARNYASSIAGVYKVSQLYYQQGLQTGDVMALTEQTLKMARISGLDYAAATNYMTNAIRSFKMEMGEAQRVVDVYSALAAASATDTTELAAAMSKTASSAEAVGSSFENTTAMMAVMIEATRESAENIGSAMKSIISRYGEMTSDPSKLVDSEGEAMSLNRVDKALQTVGISIHDANNEFRDFDDVIMELAEKWNTIDKNTQRYIATIMAGNRQQSRFLALVSSYDRLKELTETAANSEDAAQLQFLKTLDSIDAKTQQLQTSLQSLFVSSGLEKTYKTILDLGNNVVKTFEQVGKKQGLFSVIEKIGTTFTSTAVLVNTLFTTIKTRYANMQESITMQAKLNSAKRLEQMEKDELEATNMTKEQALQRADALRREYKEYEILQEERKKNSRNRWSKRGMIASAIGGAVSGYAATLDVNKDRQQKAWLTGAGNILSGIGTGTMISGAAGWVMGILTAIPGIIEAIGIGTESLQERVDKLNASVEETNNARLKSKDELKTLTDYKKKYDELNKSQYESQEKKKEFVDLQNEIAASYPELIASMDVEGNYVVDMTTAYERLAEAKQKIYKEDFIKHASAEVEALKDIDYIIQKYYGASPLHSAGGLFNTGLFSASGNLQEVGRQYKEWYSNGKQGEFTYRQGILRELDQRTYADIFNQTKNLDKFSYTDKTIKTYNAIISSMIEYADQGYSQYTAAFKTLQEHPELEQFSDYIYNFDTDLYNYFKSVGDGIKYSDELIQKAFNNNNKEWLQILKSMTDIDINNLQFEVLGKTLNDLWATFLNNYIEDHQNEEYEIGDVYSLFLDKVDISWFKAETDNIKYLQDETANKFYSNIGKLSEKQVQQDTTFKSFSSEIQKEIEKLYKEKYKEVFTNYENAVKNIEFSGVPEIQSILNSFIEIFGPDLLMNILEQYQNILNNTNLSDAAKTEQIKALTSIYNLLNIKIPDIDKRNIALQKIQSGDLTSLIGIYNLITELENTGIDIDDTGIKDALINLGNTLAINIESEVQTLSNKISSNMADFEKAISSATKGMDFKTASEMATKLGKTLSDFNFINGKYYFEDFDLINTKYLNTNQEYLDALFDTINKQNEGYAAAAKDFLDIYGASKDNKFYKKGIEGPITIKSTQEYFENQKREKWLIDYGIDLTTLETAKSEYLSDAIKEADESFSKWLSRRNDEQYKAIIAESERYKEYQINSSYLTSGNISKFLKSTINIEQNNRFQEIYKSLFDNFTEQYGKITDAIILSNSDIPIEKLVGDKIFAEYSKLTDEAWQAYEQELTNIISTADISNLPEELKKYAQLIYDTYHQVSSNIFNSVISAINGESATLIVNATNLPTLEKMRENGFITSKKEGALEVGDVVEISQEVLNGTLTFNNWINNYFKTESERLKAIQSWHKAVIGNLADALSLVDKTDTVGFDEFTTYLSKSGKVLSTQIYEGNTNKFTEKFTQELSKYGLKYSEITGNLIIEDQVKYLESLQSDLSNLTIENSTVQERNELKAKVDKAKNKIQTGRREVIKNLASNYQELSEDNIEALATAFSLNYETIKRATVDNGDGTRHLNVSALKATLRYDQLVGAEKENIEALLAAISDDYLSNISTAINYVSKGTNKQTDMQKFVEDFNRQLNLVGENALTVSQLFSWDEVLETFVLNTNKLQSYLSSYQTELVDTLGMNEGEVEQYIDSLLKEINSIDFTSFLSAENKSITGKSYKTIKRQMTNALKVQYGVGEKRSTNYLDYLEEFEDTNPESQRELAEAIYGIGSPEVETAMEGLAEEARQRNIQKIKAAKQAAKEAEEYNKEIDTATESINNKVNDDLSTLLQGGIEAVKVIKEYIAKEGREVTDSEREAAYRTEVQKYLTAMDQLSSLSVGQYIANEEVVSTLKTAGIQFEENSNVIASINDLETAYQNLYNSLAATNEATTANLNNAYAKVLTAVDQKEIDSIEILTSAMGMTYDALGELLARNGYELKDVIDRQKDFGIQQIGAGKVRITDFKQFANQMKWSKGGEEYLSAYSAYNDGLIDLNRKTEKNIFDEVKNLTTSARGDKVNLTYLMDKLGEDLGTALSVRISQYGGFINDGLLTIDKNANIQGIIQEVTLAAMEHGDLLTSEIAELADTIQQIIQSFADAITKGINGGLNNVDKLNLMTDARDILGINLSNADFNTTKEGLELSQAAAIKLYLALKNINSLQSQIVFEELSKSLTENNEKFKSSTGLLAHIKDLEKAIADENQRISAADGKVSDARLNQYNAELAVAKEILAVRSTSEDSSYNFMSNDIPGGQKNPINYISNWSKALKTLYDASGEITKGPKGELGGGFVSYQDWYNIATEMDNMAMKTGKQFEFAGITLGDGMSHASELINKGIAALSVNTSTGELEVSLGKMGISFDAAAGDLNTNVQDGIKSIAEAEVNMLDSMISVLETIVAMEQLGDIDTDNDMTIELPEIVVEEGGYDVNGKLTDGKGFSKAFSDWRLDILGKIDGTDKAYDDMRKAFKEVAINGKTLDQVVRQSADQFTDIDAKMLTALYQASKSGNYDLDNIWQSVKETLAGIEGFEGQIDVGDMHLAISNGIVLEAKNGKYIVGGLEFDYSQYQEACRAAMLEKVGAKGEFTEVQGSLGETEYQGTITIGKNDITVQTSGDEVKYHDANGKEWDSIDQVIASNFEIAKKNGKTQATTVQEFAYEAEYKIAPKITDVDTSNISQTQINNLVGKSLKDLQDAAKDAVTFEATFGFKFDSSMTEEQLAELKAKLGIENKPIETTISANAPTGEGADVLSKIIAGPDPFVKEVQTNINSEIKNDVLSSEVNPQITANAELTYDNNVVKNLLTSNSLEREIHFTTNLEEISDKIQELINKITNSFSNIFSSFTFPGTSQSITTQQNFDLTSPDYSTLLSGLQPVINSMKQAINTVFNEPVLLKIDGDNSEALNAAESARKIISGKNASINISANISSALSAVNNLIANIKKKKTTINVDVKYSGSTGLPGTGNGSNSRNLNFVDGPKAKGNVALAKGRKTLLGELGPELYVTNGHYYIAGQNGAEFIDLPDDAIVFNHLQTQRLLKNGSAGRGKAVTNEKKATSLATGNAQGPAMASAAAALAELKRIRAMWQSMLDASLSDLGQQAGGGGGGGGGGKDKNKIDPGFIADLERWYNLLRQIDKLEKDINYQETLRNKLQSDRVARGGAIYDSQKKQLGQINDELVAHHQLVTLQEDYYNKRREVLNEETAYGAIFTFNEEGLMQYNDNAVLGKGTQYESKGGLTALAKLNAQNADGSPVLTAQQQYEMLKAWGFGADMVYDSSGKKIDFGEEEEDEEKRKEIEQAAYTAAVQAFWDKADGWKDELDELYDSYREQEESVLELQAKRNEILQQIQDNQLAVEDKVYNAIVDSRQRQIDDAQKERDALEKNQTKFIDGLSKALNKERQMYENEQEAEDLNKMRRRLGILQRSGGSASSIRSLQEQITQKEKEAYFNAQQQQIDAIQEASDLEIERLDNQIELMTETLEYQKENGLLWEQVYKVMQGTPEQMAEFITANGNEWRNYSTEMYNKQKTELDNQLQAWDAYRTDESGYWETQDKRMLSVQEAIHGTDEQPWYVYDKAMTELFGEDWAAIRELAKQYFDQALNTTGDDNKGKTAVQQSEEYQDMKADIEARKAQELENQKPITNDSSNSGKSGNSGGSGGGSGKDSSSNGKGKTKTGTLILKPVDMSGKSLGSPTTWSNLTAGSTVGFAAKFPELDNPTEWHFQYANPTTVIIVANKEVTITYYYNKAESKKLKGSDSNTKVNGDAKLAYLENNQKVQAPLDMDQTVYQPQKKWHVEGSSLEFETEQLAKDYLKTQQEKYATGDTDFIKKQREKWKNAKISQYEKGGLNYYTGLAMLHGTKQKPESVFNAEQTRILRNDILGGSNSLLSLLVDFKNAMAGTITSNDYNNINNTSSDNSINIERVEVSVQSGVVSSDYDARRAGNMMSEGLKEEMIKISRKTGFQNNIRG